MTHKYVELWLAARSWTAMARRSGGSRSSRRKATRFYGSSPAAKRSWSGCGACICMSRKGSGHRIRWDQINWSAADR